jgi:hypothetical protein
MKLLARVAVVEELVIGAISTWRAFHRDVPELQAWGDTPKTAVLNLADTLDRNVKDADDTFHRGLIEQPLSDIRAVLDSLSTLKPKPVDDAHSPSNGSVTLELDGELRT